MSLEGGPTGAIQCEPTLAKAARPERELSADSDRSRLLLD